MDNIQFEWSTGLYNALSQLLVAVRRNTRTSSSGSGINNVPTTAGINAAAGGEAGTDSQGISQAAHQSQNEDADETELMTSSALLSSSARPASVFMVKFDLSNINLFVTNAVGGKKFKAVSFFKYIILLLVERIGW